MSSGQVRPEELPTGEPAAAEEARTGTGILKEILSLTKEMSNRKDDADFLVESVENRQKLMDEFDRLRETDPDSTSAALHPELRMMAKNVMYLDSHISAALSKHKDKTKEHLKESKAKQQVMGYVNKAMSYSGSYMDYKK